MKYLMILLLLPFMNILVGQDDCIPLYCDDDTWLNEQIESEFTASIQQCFYLGQPVLVRDPNYLIDHRYTIVEDCFGN